MSMTITLPPEQELKLAQRAASIGQDVTEYVQELIKRDISTPSLAELLLPVHQAVHQSSIAADELDTLLQDAIQDSRTNRRP